MKIFCNDIDHDDVWEDVLKGSKTYTVFGESNSGNLFSFDTDNPKVAIKKWFEFEKKCPLDTYISTVRRADAIKLLQCADEEYLSSLFSRYGCPYKLDYLIESVEQQLANGCRGFYEKFGDQIHPFSVG